MHVPFNNKALQTFRADRELKKRKAIKRKQIREQNPHITDAMLERCVEAQIKEEERVKADRHTHKRKSKPKPKKKRPQVFHINTMRQQLEGLK